MNGPGTIAYLGTSTAVLLSEFRAPETIVTVS